MFFEINLIKEAVLPREKRRMVFALISIYLFVCGVLLVFLADRLTHQYLRTQDARNYLALLQSKSPQAHRTSREMAQFYAETKDSVKRYVKKLGAIDNVLSRSLNVALFLQRISAPLPSGVTLDSLSVDGEKRTLMFEISFPIPERNEPFDVTTLLSVWREDAQLAELVTNINSEWSLRQRKNQTTLQVSQFSCNFK